MVVHGALYENVRQFSYHEVATLIAVTFLMVVAVDNLSALSRRGLVGYGHGRRRN